tara:strand:- start:960 stop:1121 length:162 start_codon:yes stop_codon:yes gene_type:complete
MKREKHVNKIIIILISLWLITILGIVSLMFLDFLNDDLFWDAIGDGNIFGKPE